MKGIDRIATLAQGILQSSPVLVVGSGYSAGCGVRGMPGLATHLQHTVSPKLTDQAKWDEVLRLLPSVGLEVALQQVQLSADLLAQVISLTRSMVTEDDLAVFTRLLDGKQKLALTRLFRYLFQSTNTVLHAVTTNYDRLIEYAADHGGFAHDTGFTHGYFRHRASGTGDRRTALSQRLVRVSKVHGSIDWFRSTAGPIWCLPLLNAFPCTLTPLLVAPGAQKYESAFQDPFRSAIASADAALLAARAYLCLGYGFRDAHIQPKLIERVSLGQASVIVLAKTLTPEARHFIQHSCSSATYMAIEECGDDCTVYSHENPSGLVIPRLPLWELDHFLENLIL